METREEAVAQVMEDAAERVAEACGRINERYGKGILTGEEALAEKVRIMEQGRRRAENRLEEQGIRLTPDERKRISCGMMEAAALRKTGTQLAHAWEDGAERP